MRAKPNKYAIALRNRRHCGGQVLMLALVLLLGLILMILLLFDLHNSLRAKVKREIAHEAAALAGAQWQVKGLNMLGQINLIKASSMMIDDDSSPIEAPEFSEIADEPTRRKYRRGARILALTEMQSRIAFLVPVLGCFAVQQTAKQNGLSPYETPMTRYYENVLPIHDARSYYYNGYLWHEPYRTLVGNLLDQGCAVRINSREADLPEVYSGGVGIYQFLLSDRSLYQSLQYGGYCHWQLKRWAEHGAVAKGDWWKVAYTEAPFVGESEIMTLGVRFSYPEAEMADSERELLRTLASRWGLPTDIMGSAYLDEVKWCQYDYQWSPDLYAQEGYDAHIANFQRNVWLREDIRPGVLYDGAYTAVDSVLEIPRFGRTTPRPPLNSYKLIQGSNSGRADRTLAVEQSSHQINRVGAQGTGSDNYGVVAKPIGYFQDGKQSDDRPNATAIILPVFKQAALVPKTLPYHMTMMSVDDDLKRFLAWLRVTDDFREDSPPAGTEWMRSALLLLESESYMKSIFNLDFLDLDSVSDKRTLFEDSYKYSAANPRGAGWLQQAWIGDAGRIAYYRYDNQGNPVEVPDGVLQEEAGINGEVDGSVRTYYGSKGDGFRYFLTKNGKILTNEKIACGPARTGGNSGDLNAGSNTGPPGI